MAAGSWSRMGGELCSLSVGDHGWGCNQREGAVHYYSGWEAGREKLRGKPGDGGADDSPASLSLPPGPPLLNPESGAEKGGEHSSRCSATHHYRNGEHGTAFTLKSEHGRGATQSLFVCVYVYVYVDVYMYVCE